VTEIHTEADAVRRSFARPRSNATLLASLAGLATLLVCIGIGGLMSYVVTRRTREVGLRMALGATRGRIARRILGEVAWLWGIGVAVGVPLALIVNRLIVSRAYGAQGPTAPIVGAALVFYLVAVLLAGWLPARRAAGVDPAELLRWE
jgi:ABC-type antimicrobial peptide transport system permease subunit